MRIPVGNFGFKVPNPTPHHRISGEGIDAAARAAQELGQTAMQISRSIFATLEQEREEQRRETEALMRARAGNALLDYETRVKELNAELKRKLLDGDLPYDQAVNAFKLGIQKIEVPHVEGVDAATAENINRTKRRVEAAGLFDIQQEADKAKYAEFKAQTDRALDLFGKKASMPGADVNEVLRQVDALDTIGRVAYGPNWSNVKQSFHDNVWAGHATQRAMQARDDYAALQQLERELTEPDGYYANKLDPDKRNAVLRTVISDRMRLENRLQHETAKREARAEKVIAEVERQIASGVPATAEMWMSWSDAVKGTAYESEFKQLLSEEQQIQKVLRMPIERQLSFVREREAKLLTQGGTVRDQANLNRLKEAINANVKQLQEAPLLFLQSRTGVLVQPIDFAMLADPDNAGRFAKQIRDRVASISALRKQYGPQVQMRPLLPHEAQQLYAALGQATPRQQTEFFGSLRMSMQDDDAYVATMRQIAPDAPVKALAGIIYAKQRKVTLERNVFTSDVTATSGDVATTILEGEALLKNKEKAFPMPADKDFRDAFAIAAGQAFAGRPQAYEVAIQAVRSYYAGKAAQDGDVSGVIDGKRMKHAIAAVLGEVVDYNGRGEVLAPWGMDKRTFEELAEKALREELKRRGMPESVINKLSALGLRNRGDTTYYVVQGRNFLHDPKGQPITIDLSRQK